MVADASGPAPAARWAPWSNHLAVIVAVRTFLSFSLQNELVSRQREVE